jgi:hypothetical protein
MANDVRPNRETETMRCQSTHIGGRASARNNAAGQEFFNLGMTCAIGSTAPDLISAHKWFNLAAMHGNKQASALRVEIAAELSERDIAAAQRAARDWLATR